MNLIKAKILPKVREVFTYWKTPPEGRYMNFREIASLSFGGIGIKLIYYCVMNMILSTTNTLIGNTIGIDPQPLYVIYILSVLSNFPLTAIRATMIDNTRSMKGKYRPYILSMAIPTALLGIGFVWMPYENMSLLAKCVTVLLYNIGFQFFFNFMNESYEGILNVLSPNTIERTDVSAVKMIVENFSPSIATVFLPLIAKAITGENTLYDMSIYRVVYPIFLTVGVLISIPVHTNTREKIVQAKTHVIQIRFTDAMRSVMKNKYFWVISLAGWLGFLEGSFTNIIAWMYNYQEACTAGEYSIITAISGNAAFWPNIFAPLLIRKYGKKNILIFTNLLSVIFILLMIPVVRLTGNSHIIWLMLLITFINTFTTCMGHFMNPSIQADIRDYQQYITGERIDGMFSAVGLIGSVITLLTSSVLPTIYAESGLNKETAISLGYDGTNVYDVLYDSDYFIKICTVLLIASVIGALLNVIPFFFYDLTENKQKSMISVLKIRAMFEDYGNGILSDKNLAEAVEIINNAEIYGESEISQIDKTVLKKAKNKEEKVSLKKELKLKQEENNNIEISKYVLAELHKFETEEGKAELENARKIASSGLHGFMENEVKIKDAKRLPKSTDAEKAIRRDAIELARKFKTAKKTVKKYFPNGIKEFDETQFETLFAREDDNELKLRETALKLKEAKENKDYDKIRNLKVQYGKLKTEKRNIQTLIQKATSENSLYHRAAKPYLDAKRTVKYSENLSSLDTFKELYQEAKERL